MESALFRLPDGYVLDDIDIFAYRGVIRNVPGYGDLKIRQLTAWEWFYVYLPSFSSMGAHFSEAVKGISMLDNGYTAEKITAFRDALISALLRERVRMQFVRTLKKIGVFSGSPRRFLKAVTMGDMFEVFFLLYMLNTEGVKKKFTYLMNALHSVKTMTSGTSSPSASAGDGSGKLRIVEKIDEEYWKARFRGSNTPTSR